MQKDIDMYLCIRYRLDKSLTHIRLDTDASSFCAMIESWVGYTHSSREMDNTVFPYAQCAWVLELMKATKFLSELTWRSHCVQPLQVASLDDHNQLGQMVHTR